MLIGSIIILSCLALFIAMVVVATRREIEDPFKNKNAGPNKPKITVVVEADEQWAPDSRDKTRTWTVNVDEYTILESRIITLKNRLQNQLDSEKYEDAAKTRDEIAELEEELKKRT